MVTDFLSETEEKKLLEDLSARLGILQRKAIEKQLPILIVFEGWDAAGKGELINRLTLSLDARGFQVYSANTPNREERLRHFLWRFWQKTPEKGRITILNRSWYTRALFDRVEKNVKKSVWQNAYPEIRSFEKQLTDSGTLIVKFFLHISKKEQKKRFKKLEKNPSTRWKINPSDWKNHKKYNLYLDAVRDMFLETETDEASWYFVNAYHEKKAAIKVFSTLCDKIESKLNETLQTNKIFQSEEKFPSILSDIDLTLSLSENDYKILLKKYQKRVWELEHLIFLYRIPVIIVFEGSDAAGKGGSIRRLVEKMDPRGYEVIPIAAPNDIEKKHPYLWRFWNHFPKQGHICVFDRSWYGRVLVERVENFTPVSEWKKAYQEINETEKAWSDFGAVILKYWLQTDSDTQLQRFEERQKNPLKQWKITPEDWRNREKWNDYEKAADEMIDKTNQDHAPWIVVPSNCKRFARIKILKTFIEKVEQKIKEVKK